MDDVRVPDTVRQLVARFDRNQGEYLHVCCDDLSKRVAVPISYFYLKYEIRNPSFMIPDSSFLLVRDDRLLSGILNDPYPPKSPYAFSVIGVEILGEVYEQFLGKVIRHTPGLCRKCNRHIDSCSQLDYSTAR